MAASKSHHPLPTLTGRWTLLRVVNPSDYEFLHRSETSLPELLTYRQRGVTLPPEEYVRTLRQGVQAQFVVCKKATEEPVGVVALYGADFRNRHGRVAGQLFTDARSGGWATEGFALFIDYCFRTFDLRKLYFEVNEFNLPKLEFLSRAPFQQEGQLVGHEYLNGHHWDQYIFALHAREWFPASAGRLGRSELGDALMSVIATSAPVSEFIKVLGDGLGLELDGGEDDELARLDELGLDSLARLEVAIALEEELGRAMPTDLLDSLSTVADLYALLEATYSSSSDDY